uniref:Pentatricopeptide repeat-containing protein n=1 Tax=Kalanchoe fedtschenkoi TaxID=63787 RepID=A0A7N0THR1_KALFE
MHSAVITLGMHLDMYIANSLINMYVKCGSLHYAVQLFDVLSESHGLVDKDVTLWNSVISGYFSYCRVHEGMAQLSRMLFCGVRPDGYTLSIVLGLRAGDLSYEKGKEIHAYVVRNIFDSDPYLVTALIDMYSGFGFPGKAWHIFEHKEDKSNVVEWNVMMGGFCENGLWEDSLELFSLMKRGSCQLASASYTSALTACSQGGDAAFGKLVHCDAIKTGFQLDPFVATSLITMYSKCALVAESRKAFDQVPDKEIELWNSLISALVSNGYGSDAAEAYCLMRQTGKFGDTFTTSILLSACSLFGLNDLGRTFHAELIKRPIQSDVAVQSALLTMYSKCGNTEDAGCIFETMSEKDLIAWGSMLSGLCQNKKFHEALQLFVSAITIDGIKPDSNIMTTVISSCAGLENQELGSAMHGSVVRNGLIADAFVATALIDLYSMCSSADMAGQVFSGMEHKSLVAWNSIMSCCNHNDIPDFSIRLFPLIISDGLSPDAVSITIVLSAVSSVGAVLMGKILHAYQIRHLVSSDIQVENALVDMYIKCGCLTYAQRTFENMTWTNLVTWNSMIAGYGNHGECAAAIRLFNEMKGFGIVPDEVTFLSLLSSCSHSGLVEEGLKLFQSMKDEYSMNPQIDHYMNIVDLLGRAGRVDDAFNFIQNMPIEPDESIWICLLCACRVHRKLELGELAADKLMKMEPARGSYYVQLLNLYGDAALWDRAAKLRAFMKKKGIKKIPGCSWIELGSSVETFCSGDLSSSRTVEIYEALDCLKRNMGPKQDCPEEFESFQGLD